VRDVAAGDTLEPMLLPALTVRLTDLAIERDA
jgi:hypothetical protein